MYTPEDHQDMQLAHDLLHWAAELINGVMERHRKDPELNLQTVSFLSGAKQDADLADRTLGEVDVYQRAVDLATRADREVTLAERYMNWREGEKTA